MIDNSTSRRSQLPRCPLDHPGRRRPAQEFLHVQRHPRRPAVAHASHGTRTSPSASSATAAPTSPTRSSATRNTRSRTPTSGTFSTTCSSKRRHAAALPAPPAHPDGRRPADRLRPQQRQRYLENRAIEIIDPASPPLNGNIGAIDSYLNGRRSVLFNNYPSLIPGAQPANPDITITAVDHNPISGNQEEEFVLIRNAEGTEIDISGWTLIRRCRFHLPARHRHRARR